MNSETNGMIPLQFDGAPAGREERSDERPAGAPSSVADVEVVAKPRRRQYSAEYKLRILEEADRCRAPGDVGRLLRREGLYSSHLAGWRKARHDGTLRGLTPRKRGRRPVPRNPLQKRVDVLEAEVVRLRKKLATAETILEVQGKVAGLLGLHLDRGKNS